MKEVLKYANCFVCGDKNKSGLQAKFYYDGEKAFTEIAALESFEGYKGIFHGGVISSLLDEVMIKAILADDIFAVTAEMTVKYIQPVKVDTKLKIEGYVTKGKGRIFFTEGKVIDTAGNVYATATGKYIKANDELKAQLMKSKD
ncbi:MAG: PaaI family thioesterase [Calditrichaeota bacterium]|nr:MAG: PaaI family thioesterase [Calditrichota bacterium]